MMNVSLQISLHFKCGRPTLEGKHRLPIQPEICFPKIFIKNFTYLFVFKLLFGNHKQFGKVHRRLFIQLEFSVRMSVLPAIDRGAAKRIIGVFLIEPIIFVQNAYALRFDGRHVAVNIPHNFEMVIHFSSAAHIETFGHVFPAVAASAGKIEFFQKVDMLAFHLSVADEIKRRGQSRKSRSYDVRRFAVYAFGFHRAGKCFIVTT